MAQILYGTHARDARAQSLASTIKEKNLEPTLVIIQVGSRPDSEAYIRQKKALAEKIGIAVIHQILNESIAQEEVLASIETYNTDTSVHGIIIQIPLPLHLDKTTLIEAITPEKDVDGLTSATHFMPATARGIKSLCEFYNIILKNKKVTVIGKSALVGTPIANMCRDEGAIVTTCDKKTGDLVPFTQTADILIVAAGSPHLITARHIHEGQIIIDVGITEQIIEGKRRLVGDVDFNAVSPIVTAITPVPGGVGPMTVVSLLENVVESAVKKS